MTRSTPAATTVRLDLTAGVAVGLGVDGSAGMLAQAGRKLGIDSGGEAHGLGHIGRFRDFSSRVVSMKT